MGTTTSTLPLCVSNNGFERSYRCKSHLVKHKYLNSPFSTTPGACISLGNVVYGMWTADGHPTSWLFITALILFVVLIVITLLPQEALHCSRKIALPTTTGSHIFVTVSSFNYDWLPYLRHRLQLQLLLAHISPSSSPATFNLYTSSNKQLLLKLLRISLFIEESPFIFPRVISTLTELGTHYFELCWDLSLFLYIRFFLNVIENLQIGTFI